MVTKSSKNGPKMVPKSYKNGPKRVPKMVPTCSEEVPKMFRKKLPKFSQNAPNIKNPKTIVHSHPDAKMGM